MKRKMSVDDQHKFKISSNNPKKNTISKTGVQFFKFFITGIVNTIVDFSVFNILILLFGIGGAINYLIFRSISFLAGVTNSFFWNRNWVFKKSSKRKIKGEAFLFFTVALIGFTLNGSVSTLMFVNLSHHFSQIPQIITVNLSAITGLIFVMVWDFWGYKLIVFKE